MSRDLLSSLVGVLRPQRIRIEKSRKSLGATSTRKSLHGDPPIGWSTILVRHRATIACSAQAAHSFRLKGSNVGNPFVHLELCTPDPAAAKTFYPSSSAGLSQTWTWAAA
jgi:hypothetical protein